MNLVAASPWWLIGLLLAALVAAAVEDAFRLRISNLTCGAVVVLALVAMTLQGFPHPLWQNALVFFAFLTVGTAIFATGLFGGGDIKLMSAVGLWLNLAAVPLLLISIAIAGGALALAYIGARKLALARVTPAKRSLQVPYGLAIVAGSLLVFSTQLDRQSNDPLLARLGATKALNR